jgi:hypothetical protein
MILLLGNGLIYWTGIIAGISFILAFFGCRCNSRINIPFLNKNHSRFMFTAFIFILIHISLGILSKFGVYI